MEHSFSENDHSFMQLALEEAKRAADRDEVPIGAVIIDEKGDVLAQNGNRTRALKDPSAHAEILVIREACEKMGAQRIPDTTLYITLEPCAMCAAAISFARIARVVFGADDAKGGGVLHGGRFYEQATCHHRPEIKYGIMKKECATVLQDFFRSKR